MVVLSILFCEKWNDYFERECIKVGRKKIMEKKDQNNSDDDKRKMIEREQGRDLLKLCDMYYLVQLFVKLKKYFIGEF